MFRIELLDAFGVALTLMSNTSVLRFKLKFFGGSAQLFVPKGSPEATSTFLKKFNRIKIKRWNKSVNQYQSVFYGVIMKVQEEDTGFAVGIEHILEIFKFRHTSQNQSISGQAGAEAFSLLTTANSGGNTGVTAGTQNVSAIIELEEDETPILDVWENIADQSDGEFEITADGKFNFLDRLGEDKSGSLTLYFRRGEESRSNIYAPRNDIEASKFITRLIAYSEDSSGNPLRSVIDDVNLQAEFGIVTDTIRINSAKTQTALDTMAQEVLNQRKNQFSEIDIALVGKKKIKNLIGEEVESGIDFFDFNLGDDVNAEIYDDFQNINETRRILAIGYMNSQNNDEIRLTLSKIGAKRLSKERNSDKAIREDLLQRMKQLERIL
ncbi:MAG: hypothetical protein ACOCUT_01860 [bacterium]